jgi:hypothetical protein
LKKEIKEDTRIWKDLPVSLIGRIHLVNVAILPIVVCRFNLFSLKMPMSLFTELEERLK